jgi:hypothetical protein
LIRLFYHADQLRHILRDLFIKTSTERDYANVYHYFILQRADNKVKYFLQQKYRQKRQTELLSYRIRQFIPQHTDCKEEICLSKRLPKETMLTYTIIILGRVFTKYSSKTSNNNWSDMG